MSKRSLSTIVRPGIQLDLAPLKFVPAHVGAQVEEALQVRDFIFSKNRLLILTGAGISTESGIPDYRGDGVGLYSTSKRRPMQFQDFIGTETFRRRYWARNYAGWPAFSSLKPNYTHQFLANLENHITSSSLFLWLVTQNIDSLHLKAGSRKITELHGTAFQVVCLSCENMITRMQYQEQLQKQNPEFHTGVVTASALRPDADVELSDEQMANFQVVPCDRCGGVMKPNIVYFGETVPKRRVEFLYQKTDECDGLLVLGSSLQVYSGYRFVFRAAEQKKPICIVNIGATRADHLATLRLDKVRCGDLLSRMIT